jgi:TRAP-type C4-dicarboxylate transport system permease large subunit
VVGICADVTPAVVLFVLISLHLSGGRASAHSGTTRVLKLCVGLHTPPADMILVVRYSVALLPGAFTPAQSLWAPLSAFRQRGRPRGELPSR